MKSYLCHAGLATFLLAGCNSLGEPSRSFTPTYARFFLESNASDAAAVELPVSGVRVSVGAKPVFTEGDVATVELVQVDLGRCLMFQLTPAAARDLYRVTGANQGRRLVLLLNQVPVGARRIDAPLTDGQVLMFVEVSDAALPVLVANLKMTAAELQRAAARQK